MKKDDPLDKNVTIGAELTEKGFKANARMRTVAALDRLVGNAVDFLNLPIERRNVQARAKIEGERKLIEAISDYTIDRMKTDPEFANRAAENYIRSIGNRQENKDGVAKYAIEDLRRDTSSEEAGPELDSSFLNKFERLAEDASSEQLREKWGRVLAGEIRRPGTFSSKVLRVVDELEQSTAILFETLCESRLGYLLPRCLTGDIPMPTVAKLVGADLLVEPGLTGQYQPFGISEADGQRFWLFTAGRYGFAFANDGDYRSPRHNRSGPILAQNNAPGVPIFLLTDSGRALSTILPDKQDAAADRLGALLAAAVQPKQLTRFSDAGAGYWQAGVG